MSSTSANVDQFLLFVKIVCSRLGIDIRKYMPGNSYWASLERMLSCNEIDLVLDVGANTGQFAIMLRKSGYKGRIVSFEPLESAYAQLVRNAERDPYWTVAPRMAIGDMDGEISINISANSVSSSIAGMLKAHLDAVPDSIYVSSEITPISRLDTVASTFVPAAARTFLKIDTQGYELKVLTGASQLIPLLKGLQLELSLLPLYEGGGIFTDMVGRINGMGFDLCGIFDAFTDSQSGRMFQADGIFFRTFEKSTPYSAEFSDDLD